MLIVQRWRASGTTTEGEERRGEGYVTEVPGSERGAPSSAFWVSGVLPPGVRGRWAPGTGLIG